MRCRCFRRRTIRACGIFDLSPDGTLLAFTDVEPVSNRLNIFVTTWPDLRERQQVTTEGGAWPRFSKDSRRVFYTSGGRATSTGVTRGELRVAAITTAPLSVGTSKLLMVDDEPGTPNLNSFAVGAERPAVDDTHRAAVTR